VDRGDRGALAEIRAVLGDLLDRVAVSADNPATSLAALAEEFVKQRTATSHFDWRYYLVRYPTMREGNSGIYYGAHRQLGYELTMLLKTVQNSLYRDAYLYAIWCEAGRPSEVEDPWFFGYSTNPRWMKLSRSGIGLHSLPGGIAVQPSASTDTDEEFQRVCVTAGAAPNGDGWLLAVPQTHQDDERIDSMDRVQLAAGFLKELLAAGL
jgi:hypothetical protein